MSTLFSQLQSYCATDALPMHMPGHKRNTALAPYLDALCAGLDITEIHGFSDLHDPAGALAKRMEDAAALYGSCRAWWLIGGSTVGILAGIFAATQPGDEVIIARNCHKSVYHALLLRGLVPHYIYPACFPGESFSGPVTAVQAEAAFRAHPNAKLLILTSPTYEGVTSDVAAVSGIAHRHGARVFVDEAHGAHFGLSPAFPESAVTQGADLVVQSLHKTLPSLTQTGLLHLCSDRVDPEQAGFWLSVFETSSPSYLLMASIDGCVALLNDRKGALCGQWTDALAAFRPELKHLRLIRTDDPAKLVISTRGANITGPGLMTRLREEFRIELELAAADYAVAMTGMGDIADTLRRFAAALDAIDGTLSAEAAADLPVLPESKQEIPMAAALASETETRFLAEAVGRVSADFLWAYPPGIPLITPGELVTATLADYDVRCAAAGVVLHGTKTAPDGMLNLVKTS